MRAGPRARARARRARASPPPDPSGQKRRRAREKLERAQAELAETVAELEEAKEELEECTKERGKTQEALPRLAAARRELQGCLRDLTSFGTLMTRKRALLLVEDFTRDGRELLTKQSRNSYRAFFSERVAVNDGGVALDGSYGGDANLGDRNQMHHMLARPPSPVTVAKLLKDGVIAPGLDVLSVENLQGTRVMASLSRQGRVLLGEAELLLASASPASSNAASQERQRASQDFPTSLPSSSSSSLRHLITTRRHRADSNAPVSF